MSYNITPDSEHGSHELERLCSDFESCKRERDALRAENEELQRKLSEAFDSEVHGGHEALQRERALRAELEAMKEERNTFKEMFERSGDRYDRLEEKLEAARRLLERWRACAWATGLTVLKDTDAFLAQKGAGDEALR